MGSSCKQVCGDGVSWSHTLMEAPTLENLKNKPVKRKSQSQSQPHQLERLKCPRCDSNDTKFCYYNNYNKSQPRHFCKSCKRHWTRGGTLRDVPVGGSRKNKRLKTSTAATATEDKERVDPKTDEARMSPSLGNDQKGISQVLQCELINEMFKNSFPFMSQNQRLQAQIQSPVRFDSGPCSISSPFRASAAYNHNGGSEKAAYSISSQPWSWEVPSSSGLVEWSHWKLDDDADPLASVDFNLPWDDSEGIKS